MIKFCSTQILYTLTAYLNLEINVILYVETPSSYKIVGKIYLLKKNYLWAQIVSLTIV